LKRGGYRCPLRDQGIIADGSEFGSPWISSSIFQEFPAEMNQGLDDAMKAESEDPSFKGRHGKKCPKAEAISIRGGKGIHLQKRDSLQGLFDSAF
jgi:hypothetical protein